MQINNKASRSWHYFLRWKWPNMSKVVKIENWEYFSNIARKKRGNCFCGTWWQKTFRYFFGVHWCLSLIVSSSFSFSCTAVCISRISRSDHSKLSSIFVRHASNCVFHSSASFLFSKSFYSNLFIFSFCVSSNFIINGFLSFSISRLFLLANVSFILSFILDILMLLFGSSSISATVVIVFFEH